MNRRTKDDDALRDLIQAVDRDKLQQALEMTPARKFWAGPELFDFACRIARSGIRAQIPGASEEEVERHLARRLETAREVDNIPLPDLGPEDDAHPEAAA